MSAIPPFPLQWPETMPRAKNREAGRFKTALSAAMKNVSNSLALFGRESGKPVADIVISSNVTLGVSKPSDPGVAIWFMWDGEMRCIPVDRYQTVEANLQAIHHVLEARRTELRHGTLALVRATFQGFKALPAPASKRSWKTVLGLGHVPSVNIAAATIENAYRDLARKAHPDAPGGSHDAMAELNRAKEEALKEIGND